MEDFKIKFCENEFPKFYSLKNDEIAKLQSKLKNNFLIPKDISINKLIKNIFENSQVVERNIEDQIDFNLKKIIQSLPIKLNDFIYIDWSLLDDIDQMKLEDFSIHFFDIWYPDSDDIFIFDESCMWIIIIFHYGDIAYSLASIEDSKNCWVRGSGDG